MLYGRGEQRDRIGALLDGARRSRSGVLLLQGEPGIGKTALLQDARARAGDMHVLTARGVESESHLPFAGLHQLLHPALRLLDTLPGPQAAALKGALGLAERPGEDRFLIGAACLTLLSELAETRPVLCLVDDAQWLDAPSRDALWFVARRLEAEGIVILVAARTADARGLEAEQIPSVEVPGLDANAAAELIAGNATGTVSPAVRDMIVSQAGGNALALVELPSALSPSQLAGSEPLPADLPLTPDVERLFLDRVRRLPPSTQRLLLVAATDETENIGTVIAAGSRLGIDPDALAEAERDGLVSVHGNHLEMRHPLVRSAIYQGATTSERRAAHLALAETLDSAIEADQRAWHRAAVAAGTDAELADELERTAERAGLRSGHAAAATALERAAELSPEPEDRGRRLVGAAVEAWRAGQPDRVGALLQRAAPLVTDRRLRAESDHLLGLMGLRRGNLLDAGAILIEGATNVADLDAHRAFEMLVDAGSVAGRSGDSARTVEIGRLVAGLPARSDPGEALLRDLLVGVGSLIEGKTAEAVPLISDAVARARDSDDTRVLSWAATGASTIGDQAAETQLLRRAMKVSRESGAVDTLVLILETYVSSAVLSARLDFDAEAAEGLALARQVGLANVTMSYLGAMAWSAALRGEESECRRLADDIAEAVKVNALANAHTVAQWAVALLDLGLGRPHDTVARLSSLAAAPVGVLQPFFILMFTPDLVEACVRGGDGDAGRRAFGVLDAFTQSPAPVWARACAHRCRALLTDDPSAAEEGFTEALRLHVESNRPFDRARTALLYGEHLRRQRRRVEAREHLRTALEIFERLGAAPWAQRARIELRATGETARKRDPSTLEQLTAQELQVAQFVAEGLSNKEVAAQLFLSPRTIDSHLRNVFAKLEITSRTQLAHLHAQTGGARTPPQLAVAGV
jgi:DNA-binding CsgD family transcriptional regulator